MEVYLFILSFISGGVALTVTYNAYITQKFISRVGVIEKALEELEVKTIKTNEANAGRWEESHEYLRNITENMKKDNYKDLTSINNELNDFKSLMYNLRKDFTTNSRINEGEIKKIYSDIQNTVGMINSLKEKEGLSRY